MDESSVHSGGGGHVEGDVDTGGGPFAGRDQVTIVGDGNVVGDESSATVIKQVTEGATVEQFLGLLAELRRQVQAAGLDERTTLVVEADVREVEEEAGKEKPSRPRLLGRLQGVKALVETVAGTAAAAASLVPLLQKAIAWAQQLFR